MNRYSIVIAGLCYVICAGCGKKQAFVTETKAHHPSEEDIRRVVVANASSANIIGIFGRPKAEETLPDGEMMDIYSWIPNTEKSSGELQLSGFEVIYNNGYVRRWEPIYGSISLPRGRTNTVSGSPNGSNSVILEIPLSIFVVHDQPLSADVYIDTPSFPRLGYIASVPDLLVRHVRSVEEHPPIVIPDARQTGVYRLDIQLDADDARRLTELTSGNIGSALLLSISTNAIVAPRITAPIDSGLIALTISKENEVERLKNAFQTMLEHSGDRNAARQDDRNTH